ncbi:MAG: hypothetical protein KGO23_17265, partial [Nitrospirota bacterium]|nr:hypothetical protein [Nitrospirota bacterium]
MRSSLPQGIRARGQKFFVDVTIAGQRRTATCPTIADAITRQAELRTALLSGAPRLNASNSASSLQANT